jgi:hypothetical protein
MTGLSKTGICRYKSLLSGSALSRLVDLFALSIWNKLMFSYVACWASKWPKQECPGHTKGINADDVPPLYKTHHLTKHKVRWNGWKHPTEATDNTVYASFATPHMRIYPRLKSLFGITGQDKPSTVP